MAEPRVRGGAGEAVAHDSAELHVSGGAQYTDDLLEPRGTLHAAIGTSERAHAKVKALDLSKVRAAPGVVAVVTARDVPGLNDFGAKVHDDPIFADGIVQHFGQALFAVAATTVRAARRAVRLAQVEYEDLPAILDAESAVAARSFLMPSETLRRGDSAAALGSSRHRLQGRVKCGGQEQFYLEGQIALAVPREAGDMLVYSSTQHPGEVQMAVAHALGKHDKDVVVECRRMGGGFGGKESQPSQFACMAAVLAQHTQRPVKTSTW
jgi:xanthine dehydrogenase large subunit